MRVVIAGLALLVAACGFSPMYAPAGGGTAIGPVQVDEIEGKAGHVLLEELHGGVAHDPADGFEAQPHREPSAGVRSLAQTVPHSVAIADQPFQPLYVAANGRDCVLQHQYSKGILPARAQLPSPALSDR